jgi:hypothetical protein
MMNWLSWSNLPVDIAIEFDDEIKRPKVNVRMTNFAVSPGSPSKFKREKILLYGDGENVSGKVRHISSP